MKIFCGYICKSHFHCIGETFVIQTSKLPRNNTNDIKLKFRKLCIMRWFICNILTY